MGYITLTIPCMGEEVYEVWINTEHILYIRENPEGRVTIALPNNIIINPKEDVGTILNQIRNPIIKS